MSMTDSEIVEFYKELKKHYGKDLVNFEVYPKQFAYQVKLYRYYKEREENESSRLQ